MKRKKLRMSEKWPQPESMSQKCSLKGRNLQKNFCNLNKKHLEKAKFEELHVVEKKTEWRRRDQSHYRIKNYRMGSEKVLLEFIPGGGESD